MPRTPLSGPMVLGKRQRPHPFGHFQVVLECYQGNWLANACWAPFSLRSLANVLPCSEFSKLKSHPWGETGEGWGRQAHLDQVGGDELRLGLAVLKEPPHTFHPRLVVLGLQQPCQLPQLLRHLRATPPGRAQPRQPRAIGAEPKQKEHLTWAAGAWSHLIPGPFLRGQQNGCQSPRGQGSLFLPFLFSRQVKNGRESLE